MNSALKWISSAALSAAFVLGIPAGLTGQENDADEATPMEANDAGVEEAPGANGVTDEANGVTAEQPPAQAEWTEVDQADLPEVVLDAIEEAAPGAQFTEGRQRQRGEDSVDYRLTFEHEGRPVEADIRLSGDTIARGTVQQTLPADELPPELQETARQHLDEEQLGEETETGERVIQKVTSIRRGTAEVSRYEWSLGRRHTVRLSPDGSLEEEFREAENLPPEVLEAVQASYPDRELSRFERRIENGETTFRMRVGETAEGAGDRETITVDAEGQAIQD